MISSVGNSSASTASALTQSLANSGVNKDTFLQLLVTQLKYQDPMNPQDSTQFVSQLATFSSLEQMTTLNTNMQSSLEMSVTSLIGKTATVTDKTNSAGYTTGTIQGIQYYADGPAVMINGQPYPWAQVQNVS